jgi:hyaluronan synthase
VIIPVLGEAPEDFRQTIASVLAQKPDEVFVAFNGSRDFALEAVCATFAPAIRWGWIPEADKRQAEALGLGETSGEIVIFVDSDTSHQLVRNGHESQIARFARWLEAIRWIFGPPAQSVLGQVGILPGRTIAFRRAILEATLDEFLRAPMKISDDREQTMFTLRAGYRTVYQSTAIVTTTAPKEFSRLFRQQYRWAKGSQFNTFRWFPIMLRRAPFACYCFAVDLVTPFFLVSVLYEGFANWSSANTSPALVFNNAFPYAAVGLLTALGWYVSMAVRTLPALLRQPKEWLRLPLYLALGFTITFPARLLGLLTAGWSRGSAWGTRNDGISDQDAIAGHSIILRFGPTFLGLGLLGVGLSASFLIPAPVVK